MKYLHPKIEDDGTITIHDIDAADTDYRRVTTPEEAMAALIYMVRELQDKLKRLAD